MRFRGFSLLGFFIALFVLSSNTHATTYVATPIFHNAPLTLETKITSQSAKGYCAVVTISNPNDEAHQGWQVEFNLGGSVLKHLHRAKFTVTGDRVTVKPNVNEDYLQRHHQRQFEFCAEGRSGTSEFLKSVTLTISTPIAVLATNLKIKSKNKENSDKHGETKDEGDEKGKADYCATVEVRNLGPDNVYDWRLSVDLGSDTLVSIEHGKADKKTGAVIVTPEGGHKQIKKDHERTIKFCAHSTQTACNQPALENRKPTVAILSPMNGSTSQGNDVFVTGMYSGPVNTGITVNGVVALTDGRFFYANNVPLEKGNNIINAVATTPTGKTAENRIHIRSTGQSKLQFAGSPLNGGLVPLKIKFNPVFISNASIQNISVDFNGDGVMDFSANQIGTPLEFTYDNPGIYVAKATVTDTSGGIYESAFAVQVLDVSAMDRKFNAIFSDMNNALICGEIDRALFNFSSHSRERYAPIFSALNGRFADIVRSYSPLQRSILAVDFSEYAVNRTIKGVDRLFLIYFILDDDGVWRIDSM